MQKNLSENTCRVCLFEHEILINLFDEVEDFQAKLCELLECCGDLKVDLADTFPKLICRDCTSELLVSAKFREKCKRTKEIISQFVPAESISESENADEEPPPSESAGDPDECYVISDLKTEIDEESIIAEQCEDDEKIDAEVEVGPADVFEHVEFLETNDSVGQYIIFEGQAERDIGTIESSTERTEKEAADTQDQDLYERIIRAATTAAKFTPKQDILAKPLIINCKCDICGAGFTHINNLKRHLLKHSPRELYTCPVCSCPFSNYEKLEEHQRQHDDQEGSDRLKDEASDVDAEQFIDSPPSNVKKKCIATEVEIREPKEKETKRNHRCNQCDKRFVSKSALGAHLRIHTGDRPFQCTECSKSFTTQGGLVLHMRRHSGFRPFGCTVCGKRFVESSNLKVHMRIHTGEKPHKCTICGRSFARVFLLQIHQRTHTGERPYQCPYCDKAFAQQGDLSSHKRIHTGERPHRCPYCGKGFIKSSALTQHMRKHSKFDGSVGKLKKEPKEEELRILIVEDGETAHSGAENEDEIIEESPEDMMEALHK